MKMNIAELLQDKGTKAKGKTEILSQGLLGRQLSLADLIAYAASAQDPAKATCIEAIEFATRQDPNIGTSECLAFVSETLSSKAPRVKWESAKVIANIAHRFPEDLDLALTNLLTNTEHEGTVVRWSAATALGQILKLNSVRYPDLATALEAICAREEKGSIQKIYRDALRKVAVGKV